MRVVILGNSGSGKSTLAKRLSAESGADVRDGDMSLKAHRAVYDGYAGPKRVAR